MSARLRSPRLTGAVAAIALASAASGALAADPPLPPPRPSAGQGAATPPVKEKALASTSGMSAPDYAACLADLRSANVTFEPIDVARDEGCEIEGAVRLASVATPFGDVAFPGKPTMVCGFAATLGRWTRDVAAPLTLAYTGQKLAEIDAGSFACRARYDKPGAVPSEHAKGDAVDIAAFVLADKRRIRIAPPESDLPRAHDLVGALRTTACGFFTTVLGPGADLAHAEHLHFDSGLHGATANYRICE